MEQEPNPIVEEDRLEKVRQQRARRKRRRRISALLTVLAIAALIGAIILILDNGGSILSGLLDRRPAAAEAAPEVIEQPKEQYSTVTIAAVGSIGISDHLLSDARKGEGYDFSPCFFGAAKALSDADLTVGNLSCNFAGSPYGSATSSAPTALASTLAGLGFDLLQTANCASIAGGMAGLESTIDAIHAAGMQNVGTFATSQDREACGGVTLVEAQGVRVAFVAFTKGLGNMSLPEDAAGTVNLLYTDYDTNYSELDVEGITAVMDAAGKQNPDVIIVLLHWGSEYSRDISDTQQELVDLLYSNGADAIIGTHSHMVGPIEEKTVTLADGVEKDVVTAYDLGDFYTDSSKPGAQTSAILKLTFTRNNRTGRTMLSDCSYTPVYCADFGPTEPNRYQVLGIENAMALYEQNYVYRVPEEIYTRLADELTAFEASIAPPAPDQAPEEE